MSLIKILGVILVLLSILFLGLQLQALEIEASGVRALAMIILTTLYTLKVKKKHIFFFGFLIVFTIADIFNYVTWIKNFDINNDIEYSYYIGNSLSILAYTFLIVRIFSSINFRLILSKFPIQTLLLSVLGVFVVYIVTDTITDATDELTGPQYVLEFLYNSVVMFLLSLSLLYYMIKDDKKAMNLLIGSICILFSEVLQLAYFYIADFNILNALCSLFLVLAFLFFYLQSFLKHKNPVKYSNVNNEIKA